MKKINKIRNYLKRFNLKKTLKAFKKEIKNAIVYKNKVLKKHELKKKIRDDSDLNDIPNALESNTDLGKTENTVDCTYPVYNLNKKHKKEELHDVNSSPVDTPPPKKRKSTRTSDLSFNLEKSNPNDDSNASQSNHTIFGSQVLDENDVILDKNVYSHGVGLPEQSNESQSTIYSNPNDILSSNSSNHNSHNNNNGLRRINVQKFSTRIRGSILNDFSYDSKSGDQYASMAAKELENVRGKDFRREMQKKKKASWKGTGNINDNEVNSIRFDSD